MPVVAADLERGLHLVPDQGEVFAETVHGDGLDAWCRVAAEAMHLQRVLVGHESDLVGAGVSVMRPVEATAYVMARVASLEALPEDDPRLAKSFKEQVLVPERMSAEGTRVLMGYRTRSSGMSLGCGMDHRVESECEYTVTSSCPGGGGRNGFIDCGEVVFNIDAVPGKPFTLYKYLTYHTSHSETPAELRARAGRTLDRGARHGYDRLRADQQAYVEEFWRRSESAAWPASLEEALNCSAATFRPTCFSAATARCPA